MSKKLYIRVSRNYSWRTVLFLMPLAVQSGCVFNQSNIPVVANIAGSASDTGTNAGGSCTAGTAVAGDVLATKTFPNGSGGMTTGTMPNNGAFDLTGAFTAGYVSSLTGLAVSSVCSTTSLLGVAGTAVCASGATTGTTISASRVCSGYSGYNLAGSAINGSKSCPEIAAPSTIAGLKVWLAADALEGLSDGSYVATWRDLSGNGADAFPYSYSRRPIYKTAILNGKPVVRFSGAGQSLMGTAFDITSVTAFLVVTARAQATDWARIMGFAASTGGDHNSADGISLFQLANDGDFVLYREGVTGVTVNGTFEAAGTFQIITFSLGAGTAQMWKNGTSFGTDPYTLVPTGSSPAYVLGEASNNGLPNTDAFGQHDFAEVIFYNSPLNNTDRATVECYLATKYGLTVAGC